MATDRVAITEATFDAVLADLPRPTVRMAPTDTLGNSSLTARAAEDLFRLMVTSRALDIAARGLKAAGRGYYTIASAGHEDNVVVGAQLRPTDPAFLHYRSGAFMLARMQHDTARDPIADIVRSFTAAADDPVSQGRHKVWGSRTTWVPPQTSTIGSHLPKAAGTAFAIGLSNSGALPKPPPRDELPDDAIVVCSFGDASLNHATSLSGINAARYARRRGRSVPILFVCEDNGLGISVDTPRGWIEATVAGLSSLTYIRAEGSLDARWAAVEEAIARCRTARTPVFLHLPTVRLWGHAGSDLEVGYRERAAIEADEARDPLPRTARYLVSTGAVMPARVRQIVADARAAVQHAVEVHGGGATLADRRAVMAPLAPYQPDRVADEASGRGEGTTPLVDPDARRERLKAPLPEDATQSVRRTLAAHINAALHDELLRRPEAVVFGEDVARKGGVYGVTGGLLEQFGHARVFDTLLDETTILGTAQGFGLLGYLPIPEIQYLAYVHNALDQLRGEACSQAFFSAGQFTNPMLVRIAGLAYQRGFGGHFHNDNSIGALRDIPGLVLATPSRGDDAAMMLRGCVALARVHGRVIAFLEPIALYHQRDLIEDGDQRWLTDYPAPGRVLLPGQTGIYRAGMRLQDATAPEVVGDADPALGDRPDVLIVTYANGVHMSLRAAAELADEGVRVRVMDLRWIAPLPHDVIRRHAAHVGRVLVVDEARATAGGIADAVVSDLVEHGYRGRVATVRSADSFVPLGPAADHVLLGVPEIVAAAGRLVKP